MSNKRLTLVNKPIDAMSLRELLDHRDEIYVNFATIHDRGIPHPKKIIDEMRDGNERRCRLTHDGRSCACRDEKLSTYTAQLREIDTVIEGRVHPIIPRLADAQRDRLHMQVKELVDRAHQLRSEAWQLDIRAEELREQSKSDAERTIDANGHQFYLDKMETGHRITAGDHTAEVSFGACGCCLDLIYERVAEPSYAPRDGDQVVCRATCMASGLGTFFVYAGGRWRGWRQVKDWPGSGD